MASRAPRRAPAPPTALSRDELIAVVHEALAAAPGLKSASLKKALPKPLAGQHLQALALLRELAAEGKLVRYVKGKTERFFAVDPIATLDRAVPELLKREGPLDAKGLAQTVERDARGHGDLTAEWLKSALARRVVFEHAPRPKSRVKRYGAEPDLTRLLDKTLAELKKALTVIDASGVPRERVSDALREALGLQRTENATASTLAADRDLLRAALGQLASEHRPGTLLLVHELRARTPLDKERFDAAALALARDSGAVLHHHDHAAALSEEERRQLVADGRGTHYIGIAPRSPT